MKSWSVPLISLATVLIGVGIGVTTTQQEFAHEQGLELVRPSRSVGTTPITTTAGQPKIIVVGGTDYDFGVMEKDETMYHTFELKNIGDAPATLKTGETTCKCTLSELSQGRIQPGEVVKVDMEWKPNSFAESFRQSANIITSDPNNRLIKLGVHGRVIQTVRLIPEEIVLSNVSAGESRSSVVHVYCFRAGEFELKFDRFENTELEKLFDVQVKPLPPVLIDEQPNAKSGAMVTVSMLPGLPLGSISQTLLFTTNLDDVPQLGIPVRGTVTGDITVIGSGELYNRDLQLLTLGGVQSDEGGVFRLQLLVKGPHARTTELSVGEVDPAGILQVEIDTENPTHINDGAVLLYPFTITIPPGSRSISRLGGKEAAGPRFGKIVIETTHPQAEQIKLLVKFAVEG